VRTPGEEARARLRPCPTCKGGGQVGGLGHDGPDCLDCPDCQGTGEAPVRVYASGPFQSWREAAEQAGKQQHQEAETVIDQEQKQQIERNRCRWCFAPAGAPCKPQAPRFQHAGSGLCFTRIVDFAGSRADPRMYRQKGEP